MRVLPLDCFRTNNFEKNMCCLLFHFFDQKSVKSTCVLAFSLLFRVRGPGAGDEHNSVNVWTGSEKHEQHEDRLNALWHYTRKKYGCFPKESSNAARQGGQRNEARTVSR